MLARFGFAFAILLATVLAGCGGKAEVKKNEGKLVNTMPSAGGAPGGGAPGAPAKGAAEAPPAIPPLKE